MKVVFNYIVVLFILFSPSIIADTPLIVAQKIENFKKCNIPRPHSCYQLHKPVCGVRNSSIYCNKKPCPKIEKITYSNDCLACFDKKVLGYIPKNCSKTKE